MENKVSMIRFGFKSWWRSFLLAPFLLGIIFLLLPNFVFAYDAETTHQMLTKKAGELSGQLTSEEIGWLAQGAIDEDMPPRWLNHFYDPVTGEGWNGEGVTTMNAATVRALSAVGLSSNQALDAKNWAQNSSAQVAFFLYKGDQTWQKAINEYAAGNKKAGLIALGHVLHLLEDMTVPEHTRNDTHLGFAGDPASPYETAAKGYTINSINDIAVINLNTLDDYFDVLANYSNHNFVSENSIDKYPLIEPTIKKFFGPRTYVYKTDERGEYPVYFYENISSGDEKKFSVDSPRILSAYWSRLAPKAVGAGAGVINLFFKEVENAKKNPEQYKTSTALALFTNIKEGRFPVISLFGEAARLNDAATKLIAFFKSFYSASFATQSTTKATNSAPVDIGVASNLPPSEQATTDADNNKFASTNDGENRFSDAFDDSKLKLPPPAPAEVTSVENSDEPSAEPTKPVVDAPQLVFIPSYASAPGAAPANNNNEAPSTPAEISESSAITEETTSTPPLPSLEPKPAPEEPAPSPSDTIAPSVSFVNFAILQRARNFFINWQGSDNSGAEILYDLDWRDISTSTPWQSFLIGATSTSIAFFGEDGHAYNFRLRATDAAGNISNWLESGTTTIRVPHVVISEVQIGGATADDEFVELYNPGESAVDLTGWKLQKVTGSGKTRENLLTFFPSAQISAHGFYLITHPSDYTGAATPDAVYSTKNSLAPNNTVILYDAAENIIDELGFGEVAEFEGAPASGLDSSGGSLERKASAESTTETMSDGGSDEFMGNEEDTDNNHADFILRAVPAPQNTASLPEPRIDKYARPERIIDLRAALVETTVNSVKLLWTAPANGNLSETANYEIRYLPQAGSTGCLLNILWNQARVAAATLAPQSEGAKESLDIGGLAADTYYCFGVRTWNGYYWSDISNQFVVHTLKTGDTLASRGTIFPDPIANAITLIPEKNPYIIDGDIWVKKNVKLTIEPGVIIKFKPYDYSKTGRRTSRLMVEGELDARGTEENPIIFTSLKDDRFGGDTDGVADVPEKSDWASLAFNMGSAPVTLEWTQFYYGGQGIGDGNEGSGAVYFLGTRSLTIKNSLFENNFTGIFAKNWSSNADPQTLEVMACKFTENTRGIAIGTAKFNIVGSNFLRNGKGFYTNGLRADSVTLSGNNFIGNTEYGAQNQGMIDLDAQGNFWGDVSGPRHTKNPGGAGDRVSDKIDFSSWLSDKF
jgi:hypothetical protein